MDKNEGERDSRKSKRVRASSGDAAAESAESGENLGETVEREKLLDVAIARNKDADTLQANGDIDGALLIRLQETLPVFKSLDDLPNTTATKLKIALALEQRGDLNQALWVYKDIFESLKLLDDQQEMALISQKIAHIEHALTWKPNWHGDSIELGVPPQTSVPGAFAGFVVPDLFQQFQSIRELETIYKLNEEIPKEEPAVGSTEAAHSSDEQLTSNESPSSTVVASTDSRTNAREFVATAHEHDSEKELVAFKEDEPFRLRFYVGSSKPDNLLVGDLSVPEVAVGAVPTVWHIEGQHLKFLSVSKGSIVQEASGASATFDLTLPSTGMSETVELLLEIPSGSTSRALVVVITVGGELYRTLSINLLDRVRIATDHVCTDPSHLNLSMAHEWLTPPEEITINVIGTTAIVTSRGGAMSYDGRHQWLTSSAELAGHIDLVRAALESFREAWSKYLDAVDDVDMLTRLSRPAWKPFNFASLLESPGSWSAEAVEALQSRELYVLASRGARLYDACFPHHSSIRKLMDSIPAGAHVIIHWTAGYGDWVSHVPWKLMYRKAVPVDPAGLVVIDCQHFLGLCLRLSARTREPRSGSVGSSRALGSVDDVKCLHLLFWGTRPNDQVTVEAEWQKQTFGAWRNQTIIPNGTTLPKAQIIRALDAPSPAPAGVLYFYCHCTVGNGSRPVLRFGDSSTDVLEDYELSAEPLVDSPLVFANACMTARADPHGANELEALFFRRGVRAFLGTETKVPVKLASRFAWLYFQFFYRRVTPAPVAAGEALTQATLFLYTQYGNLGGLFYTLTNGYDLYLASDQEIRSMQRAWT